MYQRADTFTDWLDKMYHSVDTKNVGDNPKYQRVDKMYHHVDTLHVADNFGNVCRRKMYQSTDTF